MPLLVGLLDSYAIWRMSLDTPIGMDSISDCVYVELDELAAKQSSSGILNSIANMANTILSAGVCLARFQFP